MSMISAQCDELRQMAESVGLAMPQAATLMMEAADALDSLDLALDSKRIAERRVTELLDENAKLRGLVRDTHADLVRLKDAVTTFDHEPTQDECVTGMLALGVLGAMNHRMRELGIEVDE